MEPCSVTLPKASSLELYNEGRLDGCLRVLAGASSTADQILRVRALIRKNDHLTALDAIAAIRVSTPDERALLLALKSSCHSYRGELSLAREVLCSVHDPHGVDARFEVAYAKTLVAWVKGDPAGMEAALLAVDVRSRPDLYARWLYARSWVCALRGEFCEQLDFLQRTARVIDETAGAKDLLLLARTIRAIVHLTREIYAKETFAFAVRMVEAFPWNDELEVERFLTFRGLAWAFALRGMHEKAFAYAYLARDVAPSRMWVTASYCDQAYLARMAVENQTADALLQHAVGLAKATDWSSRGEERVSLLNVAELAADRDPATARELLAIYDAIPTNVDAALAFAHDSRLAAMEDYARGTVLAAAGERAGAVELLTRAYETFCSIGYAWRAAASALRIHTVTEERAWLRYAADAVQDFQESSVAQQIRKRAASVDVDPRVSALTPAQRRVFGLMCEGLGDKEIAQRLGISPDTAKNHAARVRAAFGVRSRAAVIASSRGLAAAV